MKKEAGFTLIEVMIVIAVIAVAGGIGAVGYQAYLPDYRLSSAVRELQSSFQQARLAAVKRKVPVVVSFNVAADTFQVFTDDVVNNSVFDAGETVLKSIGNSRGVDFYSATDGVDEFIAVQFNPRGFPTQVFQNDLECRFRNSLNNFRGVGLNIAGSSRIIKSGDAGENWQ